MRALIQSGFFMFLALVLTGTASADYSRHPAAQAWMDELVNEHGFSRQELTDILKQAQRKESILEAIARPAEKTLTWKDYRKIFIQDTRIEQGLAFWKEHKDTLARATEATGVPPEIIVAIIGVETRYGRHKGSYRVIDALATLGFDYPPRAKFFSSEFKNLLLLKKEAGIDPVNITGSYAGALGYPQFIPSSYRAYAVDFDDDGVIDLVNNPVDAIGSVANYFKAHRWEPGLPVAARARVEGSAYDSLFKKNSPKPSTTLAQSRQAGAYPLSCEQQDTTTPYCFNGLADDTAIAPLKFEGAHGTEFWLATNNFYVITRYNISRLYALAVFQLATELEKHYQP